mmetsp:Transcript_4226/g.14899  ORF Transcript_4226/g.14899 Transcript_4226/m.14899 type:complete len:284 (+) Transcript_4226:117-968(+)
MGTVSTKLVFLPPSPPTYDANAPGLVRIEGPSGRRVPAFIFGPRGDDAQPDGRQAAEGGLGRVLLCCHSNTEDIGTGHDWYEEMAARLEMTIVTFDFAGYGCLNEWKASEQKCYEDIETVLQYLVETRNVGYLDIFLLGKSLGSGLAIHLAHACRSRGQQLGGLVIQSGFTSAYGVISQRLAAYDSSNEDIFENYKKLPGVEIPVLAVHGRHDEVVPFSNGQTLSTYVAPGLLWRFHEFSACGHTDIELKAEDAYLDLMKSFFAHVQELRALEQPTPPLDTKL